MKPSGRDLMILRLIAGGYTPEHVSDAIGIPITEVDAAIRADLERRVRAAPTGELPMCDVCGEVLEAANRSRGNGERGR